MIIPLITNPILYSFRRCPYAMRARMAIYISGQTCTLREVALRDKPKEMLKASAKGTVPVLVHPNGEVIDESLDIMLWALNISDPDKWLAPMKVNESDIKTLILENDGPFKDHLDRYKYANRYNNIDSNHHRDQGLKFIEKLDYKLLESKYLFGNNFTFADAAISPFIRQFANTNREWFDSLKLPNVHTWLGQILESSQFINVMTKYPVWKLGMDEPSFPSLKDSEIN